jgi:glycosyltransferase involved in cell wall biosynthesis
LTSERIAFVYDRLPPYTLGGGERYYWRLAIGLAERQPVSYLTRALWKERGPARVAGVDLIPLAAGRSRSSKLRFVDKLVFALRVTLHLARHGSDYGVVHVACFPTTNVLAAWLGLIRHRQTRLVVDWFEVLPRTNWVQRFGRLGNFAYLMQRACLRFGDAVSAISRTHESRLREVRRPNEVFYVPAFITSNELPTSTASGNREQLLMFAGRLVSEKQSHLLPAVLAELNRDGERWRAVIFGEGPEEATIKRLARDEGVEDAIEFAGFAEWDRVSQAMMRATAQLFLSTREGFGLVVLEAAAHGLPTVVVPAPDNAAQELIEHGRNGVVSRSSNPRDIADAVRELAADQTRHRRTLEWFAEASPRYSTEEAVRAAREMHARLTSSRP